MQQSKLLRMIRKQLVQNGIQMLAQMAQKQEDYREVFQQLMDKVWVKQSDLPRLAAAHSFDEAIAASVCAGSHVTHSVTTKGEGVSHVHPVGFGATVPRAEMKDDHQTSYEQFSKDIAAGTDEYISDIILEEINESTEEWHDPEELPEVFGIEKDHMTAMLETWAKSEIIEWGFGGGREKQREAEIHIGFASVNRFGFM